MLSSCGYKAGVVIVLPKEPVLPKIREFVEVSESEWEPWRSECFLFGGGVEEVTDQEFVEHSL